MAIQRNERFVCVGMRGVTEIDQVTHKIDELHIKAMCVYICR